MEVKDFIDKLENFVFQVTPDIEELEAVMIAISKELSTRYLKTSSNSDMQKRTLSDIRLKKNII
jgi:hypothetical protein